MMSIEQTRQSHDLADVICGREVVHMKNPAEAAMLCRMCLQV